MKDRTGPSKELQSYRKEIDRIDDDILRLLNERSKHVIEIGKAKRQADADANLHTPAREAEIIDELSQHLDERHDETPESSLIAKADAEQLRAAIAKLPTPFRETLVLRDIEGLDYREIAEATEVPIGTVMSRLYRGRKLLEKALLKYARQHGYIRGAEPNKMRTRPKPPAA